jgi:predicted Zn-dependent protease
MRTTLCLAVLAVAGMVLTTGCPTTRISRSEEIRLGQEAAARIEQQYPTRTDARVSRIGQAVAAQSRAPDLPYRFRTIEQTQPNAFALPGGPVYVTAGLLQMVGNDDAQLAGVLGHEVAHITERHAVRQLERQNLMGLAISVLTEGTTEQVARIVAGLESLSYSRDQEREADSLGARYSRAAGFDPLGLVRFLDQLAKLERGGATLPMLRSHPGSAARADRLRQELRQAQR